MSDENTRDILSEVRISPKTVVRISVSYWGNEKWLSIRQWYEKDGAYHPNKKGISIRMDHAKKLFDNLSLANV